MESARNLSNEHVAYHLYNIHNQAYHQGANTLGVDPSYGQWRKIGMLLRAPLASEGRIILAFRSGLPHVTEIDGISITPVTDRQNDALRAYLSRREGQ
jgi:hypothetical protein